MSVKHLTTGSECPSFGDHKLRLYSMVLCPYSKRSRLVCAAKNISIQIVNINVQKKPEWYFQKNPYGKIPTLEHTDGRIVYESLIIAEYLDNLYPEQNRLIPNDPYLKAKHQIMLENFNKIPDAFNRAIRTKEPQEALKDLSKALDYFESQLNDAYFGGDKPAFVDYMMWPWFERFCVLEEFANYKMDEKRFPKMIKYTQQMKNDSACKKIELPAEKCNQFYKVYLSGQPVDYDLYD